MFSQTRKSIAIAALAAVGAIASVAVQAEEPTPAAATSAQNDPARIDRDGKRICGFDLMTDSERAGHKSQMYFTKDIKDRDAIRADHCARMRKRAEERGVKFEE
jgi:hypothetical protein